MGNKSADGAAGVPWWRRVPWSDLAILLSSGMFFGVLYRFSGSSPDEGLITTAAEQILRGRIPSRDFFSELAPGSFYLQAGIFRLAGSSLSSVFFAVWILGVAITWLLYRLSRKLLPWPLSLFPPLMMFGICYVHNYMLSHHWWGVLFFLLMVLCLAGLRGPAESSKLARRKLPMLMAGFAAGAALLCMQSLGAWAIATAFVWLVWIERLGAGTNRHDTLKGSLGRVFWFLAGTGIVIGLTAGYFWAHGALGALVYDNFTFLFTHYVPYEMFRGAYSWGRLAGPLQSLISAPTRQSVVSAASFYFFGLVAPTVALGGAIWQLSRRRTLDDSRARLLLLYLLTGAGCFLSQLHEPEISHFIWGSPLLLILIAEAWRAALLHWIAWRRPLAVLGGAALAGVILGAYARAVKDVGGETPVQSRRGTFYTTPRKAALYQPWIEAIERHVPPGGETFIFPYEAQLYFLTATRNPTRYDVLLSDFNSLQQFEEARATLWRQKPKYIFDCEAGEQLLYQTESGDREGELEGPNALGGILRAGHSPYRLAGSVAGMEVGTLKP